MPSQKVLERKQQVVDGLAERIQGSVAGVIVSYEGITVEEMMVFREIGHVQRDDIAGGQ